MRGADTIRYELASLTKIRPLVLARQEIAVMRIKKPLENVLAAREFFNTLATIFGRVRTAYGFEIATLEKKRQGQAVVLFSTDTLLTGPIVGRTFRYFLEQVHAHGAVPIVIGVVGKHRFESVLPGVDFEYFKLYSQSSQQEGQVKSLAQHLLRYESLMFVYGQYNTLLQQNPTHMLLNGESHLDIKEAGSSRRKEKPEQFLFEPSLEAIVSFFDSNLVALLLRQTSSENSLALLGSQITAMEEADRRIHERYSNLLRKSRQLDRQKENKKTRERMAGRRLWYK